MGLGSGLRRGWHHSFFPKEASETPCTFVGLEDIRWPGCNKEREVSIKLGMDGPGYREAKAALSVPLQKFPGASINPSSKCLCQSWLRRCSGGFLCFIALEKSWGLGKSHPGKLGDLGILLCAGLGHHIHGQVFFLQVLLLLVLSGITWRAHKALSLQADSSPDSSVPAHMGKQHFWLCSWSRRWIQLSYLMFTSCEQVLGQADICSHSALLLRYEGMALQALLRELAGFKSQN